MLETGPRGKTYAPEAVTFAGLKQRLTGHPCGVDMKHCPGCGNTKSFSEFYRNKGRKDGYSGWCKPCASKAVRRWESTNIDRVRENVRRSRSTEENRRKHADRNAEYAKANPEKVKAHNKVEWALKSGQLKREPCKVCGAPSEAHHPDYTRPLYVVWLCSVHHKAEHKRLREQGDDQ